MRVKVIVTVPSLADVERTIEAVENIREKVNELEIAVAPSKPVNQLVLKLGQPTSQ